MHLLVVLLVVQAAPTAKDVEAVFLEVEATYRALHQAPELSGAEVKTAALLAEKLKALGLTVTTGVGGHGVVGVLTNGSGPTVLVRADLDGLPVEEKTGLPYASRNTGVMHACGHDVHMASWLGAAKVLVARKADWQGTLVFVGQPAEEVGDGARAMLKDGLLTRFPKPSVAVALHDHAELPAGTVGLVPGYALANVDTADLTLYGRGGHGAFPHRTIDPVVLGAKVVLGIQTLVSREMNPLDPAVISVGSFHAGTRHNVIADEAHLQLTMRSYSPEVRQALRDGVLRIAKAESDAAKSPKPPLLKIDEGPSAVFNDVATTESLGSALRAVLGEKAVVSASRVMGGEDFGDFGATGGFRSVLLWLGAAKPEAVEAAKKAKTDLPSLHSPLFAPDKDLTLRTGVMTLSTAVMSFVSK